MSPTRVPAASRRTSSAPTTSSSPPATRPSSSSQRTSIDVTLDSLCDVAQLAEGQELFELSPDTTSPCAALARQARVPGDRMQLRRLCAADHLLGRRRRQDDRFRRLRGQVLEIPVTLREPCASRRHSSSSPRGPLAPSCAERRTMWSATTSRAGACARVIRARVILPRGKGVLLMLVSRRGRWPAASRPGSARPPGPARRRCCEP